MILSPERPRSENKRWQQIEATSDSYVILFTSPENEGDLWLQVS